jgi:PAS domain S-box-containing protein
VRELVTSIADQCGLALERARLFEAERAQRAALDAFFENAPLGVGLFDRELRFVRVNPVLAAMNGTSAEAHAGRSPAEILPTLAWDEIAEPMRQVMDTGVPRVEVPVVVPGDDGEVRHFLEAWYPVRIEGETTGLGAIIREVTAEREAEQFQRHVVGIVGHDLRTPLTTVATAARLLARGEPLSERQARIVAQIRAGAARLDQIVSVLLDYTQARAGRGIPVRLQACDLGALCRAVAEECAAARPGRTVRCDGEGDAAAECDSDRFGQALANLVSNALDYSPPDSTVDVRWRSGPNEVAISVTNAGPPIPPEVLPRIFEPFRQGVQERAARRGLGLGLFIARAIVTAHGGRIEVRSDAGGTEFTIRVPRRLG